MNSGRLLKHSWLVCGAALIGVICATAPTAFAQKGGGGGGGGGGSNTGGGTIYFINGAGGGYNTNYVWTMTSTGTNVTQLEPWGRFNAISRSLHNGFRWYLTTITLAEGYYPDGVTRRVEVFAFRDDYDHVLNNNSETRVQLTDDPNFQPAFGWWQGMHWKPGDQTFSFKARRWEGATPVDGGLYTADLQYSGEGNVIGLATQPTRALDFPLDANGWPEFSTHTWDPTGTKVAYTDGTASSLWVANLSTGTRTQIKTGNCAYPDWSPDGTKIVAGSGSIFTVKPDGSGVKTILTPRYVNNVYVSYFFRAYFSPTGSHVTCGGALSLPGGGSDNDVIRATSSGGSVTNLTNTPSLVESPIGWRSP